jgi:hypothetical protein
MLAANQMMVFTWLDYDDVASGNGFPNAVDLDPALSL